VEDLHATIFPAGYTAAGPGFPLEHPGGQSDRRLLYRPDHGTGAAQHTDPRCHADRPDRRSAGRLDHLSTFSHETYKLLEDGQLLPAFINVLASVAICLLLTWLGIVTARSLA